jgi:hypothetical protein
MSKITVTYTIDGTTYSPTELAAPQIYRELRRYHNMHIKELLKLRVVDRDGIENEIKVNPNLPLLLQLKKAKGGSFIFIVNGCRVGPKSTMINMELEENDIIDSIPM